MSYYLNTIKKQSTPYLQSLKDDFIARRDRDFFWATGTQVYCGAQGSGKTISAVKHVLDLKRRFPRCILVSNLSLQGMEPITFDTKDELIRVLSNLDPRIQYVAFATMEQLSLALVLVNNDKYGVVYLIDEIHTYFNSLDSKNIPMFVFTEISQQRKQRKLIIGTSQLFLRAAKPLREQCDNVIVCNTILGILTVQHAYDGMSLDQDYSGKLTGNLKKRGWFFHTRKIRNSYDTYQKVVSGFDQYENITRVDLTLKSKNNKISIK